MFAVRYSDTGLLSAAHASDCKSLFRNSSTCHSAALTHTWWTHTHTHRYALRPVLGSLFLTLKWATVDKSQLCHHHHHHWLLPFATDSLDKVPCGATRLRRRVSGSIRLHSPALLLCFGILPPHVFGFRDGGYGRMPNGAGSARLWLRCQQAGQAWEFMLTLFVVRTALEMNGLWVVQHHSEIILDAIQIIIVASCFVHAFTRTYWELSSKASMLQL